MVDGSSRPKKSVKPGSDRFLESFIEESIARLEEYRRENADDSDDKVWSSLTTISKAIEEPVVVTKEFDTLVESLRLESDVSTEPSWNAQLQERILVLGGIRLVIRGMAVNSGNETLQASGCELLGAIATGFKPGQEQITDLEGLEVIREAMISFEKSVLVNEKAISAMRSMTYLDKARKALNKLKCVPIVIAAMQNLRDPTIQEMASTTISNLSFGSPQIKEKAGRDGGVQALLTALKAFPDLVTVQSRCCRALRNLAWTCEYNQQLIGLIGGIPVILAAMRKFGTSKDVQENCAAALSNITYEASNAIIVAEEGGLELCVECFQNFENDNTVLEHAIATFRNVIAHSRVVPLVLSKKDFISTTSKTLVAGMKRNNKAAGLIEKGCGVIRNLAVSEEARNILAAEGAIEILIAALKSHRKASSVAEVAMNAFHNLGSGMDLVKERAGKAGAIEAILKCMHHDSMCAAVQEAACRLLDNLVDGNEENSSKLVEKDGLEAVAAAVNNNMFSAKLQEYAYTLFLKVIAADHGAQQRLMAAGAPKFIDNSLKQHLGNSTVELLANQLHTTLAVDGSTRAGRSSGMGGRTGNSARSRSRTVSSAPARSRSRNAARSRSDPRRVRVQLGLEAVPE